MKHTPTIILAITLLALSAGAFCASVTDSGVDKIWPWAAGAPEYCGKFITDTDIYTYDVREYSDATIVEKKLKAKVVKEDTEIVTTVTFDQKVLTGKAKDTDWVSLEAPGAGVCRDRIYGVYKDGDTVSVLALLTGFRNGPLLRNEYMTMDEIHPGKAEGKPLIVRTILSSTYFLQSDNTGLVTPIPDTAELIAPDVVRLAYADGAVEHWKIKPDREFIANNRQGGKDPDRMLLWTNGAGKGTQRSTNHPSGASSGF